MSPVVCQITPNDTYSALEEFLAIFTKQYLGIIVGIVGSLIFRFLDHALALRIAKKYNIKQKTIMQAAFPTLICFLQYLLRKRSKDSKLAALLSLLKRNNSINVNEVAESGSDKTSKSQTQNPTRLSSYATPKPLSSLSSNESDNESVFFSNYKEKSKSVTLSQVKSSKAKSGQVKSVSAKYRNKSTVSIKMSSSSQ